ncbi:MAG: hypothetical protein KAJ51_06090, partial [Thermoplasmata archaeon]|nr:hypothetical protein [Thermoplasmata archaeon]
MRIKLKPIIIVIIIVMSISLTHWNFDLRANNIDNERNNNSISRSDNLPRDGDFDWCQIEVISELIEGQNNNIGESRSPKIAVEEDKIYVVWDDDSNINGAGTDKDIFYRYFDGSNWSEIQIISEPILNNNINTGASIYPDIVVEDGKIYVIWSDWSDIYNSGPDSDIFYRCNLTGVDWEDIQVISEPAAGKNFNTEGSYDRAIAVENGKIYVAWGDNNNTNGAGTDRDIFYRCNLTGTNWEAIQVISEPVPGSNFTNNGSYDPAIAVENNKIYIAWRDYNNYLTAGTDADIFYRCNLSGLGWEDIQVISEPVRGKNFNIGLSSFPSISVENDIIYIVWSDSNNTSGAGTDYDIFYTLNHTGISWEPAQVISEPVLGQDFNNQTSTTPEIAVKNSRIYVVWYDKNNTKGAGIDRDIFYRCNPTSSSWEEIQVISEPVVGTDINTGDYSIYPDIAIDFGKCHVVWADDNNTNGAGTDPDIFYRWLPVPFSSLYLSLPSAIPASGNTSTNFNFSVIYYHGENKIPSEIKVNISGANYSMLEADPNDSNYFDGKFYHLNIKHLNIGIHSYQFWASDGINTTSTKLRVNPLVYNSPPEIITEENLSVIEDIYYEVIYGYLDIDKDNIGQPGIWNFSTNASWLDFNRTTAILNGTPTNDD